MADFNSSLPVRTELPGDLAVKIVDGTITSQALAVDASGKIIVKLDDAAGAGLTSQVSGSQQALDVGINVAGVQVDPRAVRALTAADVITANQGTANTHTNGWFVKLTDGTNDASLTAAGEVKVDITQPIPAGTNLIGEIKSRTEDGAGTAISSQALGGSQYLDVVAPSNGATGAAVPAYATLAAGSDGTNTKALSVDAAGQLKVDLFDATGTAFSSSNPLAVAIQPSVGTPVFDFKDAAAVAAAGSDNHDYTVTAGKTFYFQQIVAAGSGKIKVEIQLETAAGSGTFTSYFVQFNSTAETNVELTFGRPLAQVAGAKVRMIMTNVDKAAQDLYSTIVGSEE